MAAAEASRCAVVEAFPFVGGGALAAAMLPLVAGAFDAPGAGRLDPFAFEGPVPLTSVVAGLATPFVSAGFAAPFVAGLAAPFV